MVIEIANHTFAKYLNRLTENPGSHTIKNFGMILLYVYKHPYP